MNLQLNNHWVMEESALRALASARANATLDETTLRTIAGAKADYELCPVAPEPKPDDCYQVVNGIALIQLCGVMSKTMDVWAMLFGGASTLDTLHAVSKANADPSVNAILLYIDSPGGMVSGVSDLAEEIAETSKPIVAYISDCGCSGAYWVASQCDQIFANTTARIGSIGVYTVVEDTSKLYSEAGISVTLVKAGEYKGAGVDGVAITPETLADVQREIDETYQVFVSQVAAGREITEEQALALATGQAWIASKAQELGLIDGISAIDDVLTNLSGVTVEDKDIKIEGSTDNGDESKASAEVDATAEQKDEATKPVENEKEKSAEAAPSNEDVVKSAKTEGYTEALAHEQQRMTALLEVCKGSPAFALEQFKLGHDVGKCAVAYAAYLETQLASARVDSAGADPVKVGAAEQRSETKQGIESVMNVRYSK